MHGAALDDEHAIGIPVRAGARYIDDELESQLSRGDAFRPAHRRGSSRRSMGERAFAALIARSWRVDAA